MRPPVQHNCGDNRRNDNSKPKISRLQTPRLFFCTDNDLALSFHPLNCSCLRIQVVRRAVASNGIVTGSGCRLTIKLSGAPRCFRTAPHNCTASAPAYRYADCSVCLSTFTIAATSSSPYPESRALLNRLEKKSGTSLFISLSLAWS